MRLADQFADHGLIAVALAEVARLAGEAGATEVIGHYRPSGRNGMVADLYPRLGFVAADAPDAAEGDGATRWRADPARRLSAAHVPIQWSGFEQGAAGG